MAVAPCKDCGDREVGCHSTCKKYIDFKKENEKQKELINKEKQKVQNHMGFVIQQIRSTKRAHK
ncbi:MAG: hypothetical protein J6A59_15000 [Lachnospiraceae bacterium]|nr:hypothetical protein [Lachnospiraceae bacterium]